MLLGEEAPKSWHAVATGLGGIALGLIPQLLGYLRNKRDTAPVIAAKRQRVRQKDETLEQAMYDHLFDKYKIMLEELQLRVNGFEADRVSYLSENAKLKERCENQTVKINEQLVRMTELTEEVDKLSTRVQELESQAGGV